MTQRYETVEVPIVRLSDGREFISDLSIAQQQWIAEFVSRFSNYWTYDFIRCGWVSPTVAEH
jgi:hypothetical protein